MSKLTTKDQFLDLSDYGRPFGKFLANQLKNTRFTPIHVTLLFGVSGLIDSVKLTYHAWQNDDIFGFILEQCQEKNIKVSIEIPLLPGRILESRQKVKLYIDQGYDCNEQVLRDLSGGLHHEYSTVDANRINGRPDDWVPEPVIFDGFVE